MKPADTGSESRFELLEPRLLLDGQTPTLEVFGALPALFVENHGQWADSSVRYAFHGSGANVLLTDTGPVLQLFQAAGGAASTPPEDPLADPPPPILAAQVSVTFDGANTVTPVGINKSATYFNYFIGDQSGWRSNVSAYASVLYAGLYEGTDLAVSGRPGNLKYEFRVGPGADWRQVQVTYSGVQGLSLDGAGALHIATADGEIIEAIPQIYQIIDGARVDVAGGFVLLDADTYAFALTGAVTADAELVIDPKLVWSNYLGREGLDIARQFAVDGVGNIFAVGESVSADGDSDAFVIKLSPQGQHVWTAYLGGAGNDQGFGVAVRSSGEVFVSGITGSSDWVSEGFDPSYGENGDAFVACFSSDGSSMPYSTSLGGSGEDYGSGIAVCPGGDVVLAGRTTSDGWVAGVPGSEFGGVEDAFVARLTPSLQHVWSTYVGGGSYDRGYGIAVDDSGAIYTVGETKSNDSWVSGGFDPCHNGGDWDGFIVKLAPTGGHIWSSYLGGGAHDSAIEVALDNAGRVFVVGETASEGWHHVTFSRFDDTLGGSLDGFVLAIDAASRQPQWASYLGGTGYDYAYGVAVDTPHTIVVAGGTDRGGWASGGSDINGPADAYIARIDMQGSLVWSAYVGGDGFEWGYDVAADASGSLFVAGRTNSTSWAWQGYDNEYNGGEADGFVAKIRLRNQAPVAQDDVYTVNENSVLVIGKPGVLGNDSDVDGDTLTAILVAGPANGELVLNADGSFAYTPAPNYNGSYFFTYKANDGTADSNVAIVTITVNPVMPPPAPTIDLDAASDSGRSDTDDITRDNTPTFSGAAVAGSTVTIYSETTPLGQTEATAENTWTFMTGALADGVHVITATATNAAGKVSAPSDLLSVAIDTVAPVITIGSPADGAVVRLNDIVLAGYAATDGGSGIDSCVGTVPNGSPIDTASVGNKPFSVTATDVAGNSASVPHNYAVKHAIGAGETMTANLFINLANSDDIGTYFDLLVEAVDSHGNVVASGMIDRYRGLFVNNSLTNKNMLATSIVLTAGGTTFFDEGESFGLRVSMRIDEGAGHTSGRLQLQYDAMIRGSNLVADFGAGDKIYYLHDQGVMNTLDNAGDTTVDLLTKLASKQNGDPWVLLGAWTGQV